MLNGVFYVHTKPTRGLEGTHLESRATIACRVVNGKIEYGISLCMAGDNFSRKEGRLRAEARMGDYGSIDRNIGVYSMIEDDEEALTVFSHKLAASIKKNPRKYEDRISSYKTSKGEKSTLRRRTVH